MSRAAWVADAANRHTPNEQMSADVREMHRAGDSMNVVKSDNART